MYSIDRTLVFELHVPEQAPQLPQVVHVPSTKKTTRYVQISDYHLIYFYSHSQGPVSVGAAEHGWLPVWSIERCLSFELHVPEQAPQIPHPPSHAPSSEIHKKETY